MLAPLCCDADEIIPRTTNLVESRESGDRVMNVSPSMEGLSQVPNLSAIGELPPVNFPESCIGESGQHQFHDAPSLNRRILRAAGSVALAGVLVKLLATAKEVAVAARFGRSDAIDAFLIAFLIPGLLVNLFSESMNQALIPTLIRVRTQQGKAKAQEILSNSMLATCLLLISGSALMAALAKVLFPAFLPHFPAVKTHLTLTLFYCLLPVILLSGIASNCAAVLNTSKRFLLPALAPAAVPTAVILAVWLFSGLTGIYSLVYGNIAGGFVQLALVLWMLYSHGFGFRLRWYGYNEAMHEVVTQYGLVLLSGLVASGGLLVDQGMAASLPAGSVATLVYANRFVGVTLSLMAGAIATAITPYFSELVAQHDWNRCRRTVNTWVIVTALVCIPVMTGLMIGSRPLIRLAFEHGAFGSKDTASVAGVQTMYALQLPFYVASRVYYRFLLAIRKSFVILACGAINLVLDVVLNILCMRWYGLAGIALATSLWSIATFLFLAYWTYRFLRQANRPRSEAQSEC
jgi:putative peptidoglycan lipid II flippase